MTSYLCIFNKRTYIIRANQILATPTIVSNSTVANLRDKCQECKDVANAKDKKSTTKTLQSQWLFSASFLVVGLTFNLFQAKVCSIFIEPVVKVKKSTEM